MKQLTTKQAKEFLKSKVWENWTDEQIVRFQLFQKKLCMDFSRFREAVEKVLDKYNEMIQKANRRNNNLKNRRMTQKTLEKANEISTELDECKTNLVRINNQLQYGVTIDDVNSYIRYGGNNYIEIPENLHNKIAQIIKDEYEKRIDELKKQLDEL